jgi:DNA-binding NtrC family response regulator
VARLRILLVDDEEDLVFAMAERLTLRGFQVEVATRADDAMRRLHDCPFDVLILDVKMPGIGGLTLMAEAKQEHPDLPVFLFTGHGSVADAQRGVQEGAFDYLMKPIDLDQLVETIGLAAGTKKGSHS